MIVVNTLKEVKKKARKFKEEACKPSKEEEVSSVLKTYDLVNTVGNSCLQEVFMVESPVRLERGGKKVVTSHPKLVSVTPVQEKVVVTGSFWDRDSDEELYFTVALKKKAFLKRMKTAEEAWG